MRWVESLRNIAKGLPKSRVELRFGKTALYVSDIAEQYYCEAKVHNQYLYGDIETPGKREGERLHESIRMVATKIDRIIKDIKERGYTIVRIPLWTWRGDVVICGKPDFIIFQRGKPSYLVELKTTTGKVGKIWRDEVLQVMLYVNLLEGMGFNIGGTKPVIIKTKQKFHPEVYNHMIKTLLSYLPEYENVQRLEEEYKKRIGLRIMKTTILEYEDKEVEEALEWALDYWIGKREPKPTKKRKKCEVCEYRDKCVWYRNKMLN